MENLGIYFLWLLAIVIVSVIVYVIMSGNRTDEVEELEQEDTVTEHLRKVEEKYQKRLAENEHLKKIKSQNNKTYKSLGRAELYNIKDPEERKAAETYLKSLGD